MKKSIFRVPKMDCPSEEKLIRMALQSNESIRGLEFNLNERMLSVLHDGSSDPILSALIPLNFGAKIETSSDLESKDAESVIENIKLSENKPGERKVLMQLLAINGVMFIVELVLGLLADSTGLIADSLDMLADSLVYGISLYAVGKAISLQQKAARLSGYFQLTLALGVLLEVIRRFYFGSEPEPPYMIIVSLVALTANVTCLWLISHHRESGMHMKASWIFSANDVIANIGVILAGVLVSVFHSPIPDLVIGTIISIIVFKGAISILKIAKPAAMKTDL
jgi:Co/Zn/Cd efflux system component